MRPTRLARPLTGRSLAGLLAVAAVVMCTAVSIQPGRAAASTSNEETAYDFFIAKGLAAFQVAGIIGNLDVESGVDPTLSQSSGGPGRGIAQWEVGYRWDTDAQDNVQWYAARQGLSATSLNLQLSFAWYELTTFSRYGLSALRQSTTVTDATIVIQDDFEACGDCNQDARVTAAKAALAKYGTPVVLTAGEYADVDGDGRGDVLATRPDGSMWLYRGNGSLTYPFSSGVQIGASGWQAFDRVLAGDVNGDGKADLVATKPDGTMWLYHGSGSLTYPFSSGVQIGASGWQGYDRIAVGDIDGDGKADLVGTRPDGTMWLFHGDGSLTYPFSTAVQIGASGWQGYDRFALGDINADGKADLVATRSDGSMWLFHGSGSLSYPFSSGVQIGASGWQGFDRVQVGDINGDNKADLVATKPDGTMWLYAGNGSLSYPFSSGTQIGASGWQNYDRIF